MEEFKPFHIVLVEPEIPPNTGNIARLCGATGRSCTWWESWDFPPTTGH